MKKSLKFLALPIVTALVCSCTQTLDLGTVKKISTVTESSNLGPKGGGAIDPKISSGATIINFKRGDSNLVFNMKFGSSGLSTKATSDTTTSSNTSTKISKISTQLKVNDQKVDFEVPSDKLTGNKYTVNVVGLEKGDKVTLDTQAYDESSKLIDEKTIKDKEVKTDFETVDINLAINIQISVEQNVKVEQTQTVIGPTINITLPSPPANQHQPPQANIQNQPTNSSECLIPSRIDSKVKLANGKEILVCPPENTTGLMNGQKCYKPEQPSNNITLEDGTIVKICKPQ